MNLGILTIFGKPFCALFYAYSTFNSQKRSSRRCALKGSHNNLTLSISFYRILAGQLSVVMAVRVIGQLNILLTVSVSGYKTI